MSRKGHPYNNARMESFFKTLKSEEVHLWEYRSFREVLERLSEFIERVYKAERLHSAPGYVSPVEFGFNNKQPQRHVLTWTEICPA